MKKNLTEIVFILDEKGINNSCSSAWREELDEEYSRNINKTK